MAGRWDAKTAAGVCLRPAEPPSDQLSLATRGKSAADAEPPSTQALAQDIGAHTEPAREPPIAAATAAGRGAPLPPRRTHLATRGKPQGRKNRLSPKILGPTPSQLERRGLRHRLRPAEG